jgi:hypothetical protein
MMLPPNSSEEEAEQDFGKRPLSEICISAVHAIDTIAPDGMRVLQAYVYKKTVELQASRCLNGSFEIHPPKARSAIVRR